MTTARGARPEAADWPILPSDWWMRWRGWGHNISPCHGSAGDRCWHIASPHHTTSNLGKIAWSSSRQTNSIVSNLFKECEVMTTVAKSIDILEIDLNQLFFKIMRNNIPRTAAAAHGQGPRPPQSSPQYSTPSSSGSPRARSRSGVSLATRGPIMPSSLVVSLRLSTVKTRMAKRQWQDEKWYWKRIGDKKINLFNPGFLFTISFCFPLMIWPSSQFLSGPVIKNLPYA